MRWRLLVLFLLAVLVLGLSLGAWAFYLEPSSFVVSRRNIALADWPSNVTLSVALLSDLHVGSPYFGRAKLKRVVARVNENRPDLVLLAGDYVIDDVMGGRFVPPEEIAAILGQLQAPLGVYAVLGNHDWWLDSARVRRSLERGGVSVLDDEAVRLECDGVDLWLVGLADFWEGRPDVEAAVGLVPPSGRIVAFTHNPDLFPQVPQRVSLTLAGHTHGGQVKFPFWGTPIVPSRHGSRYAAGLVEERGRKLFVTSGLGTSIIPVRFRVPPEISLLTLSGPAPE